MGTRHLRSVAILLVVVSVGVLACDVSSLVGTLGGTAAKPKVSVQSPTSGSQYREGDEVSVQSTAQDSAGIVRVELAVDGAAIRSDAPPVPQGQVSFTLIQKWAATPGTHTLSVRAFNAKGAASDPVLITISVIPATASGPAGTATSILGLPSATSTLAPLGATGVPTGTQGTPMPTLGVTLIPATATATRRPATPKPAATPTISAPPGVYALSVRVDPTTPRRGQNVTFFVTFLNTTGTPQPYRWRVLVFQPDVKNSFGDTAPVNNTIPPGTSELASSDSWAVRGPGDCMTFLARVFAVNPDTREQTEFLKPDLSGGPAAGFQVCP